MTGKSTRYKFIRPIYFKLRYNSDFIVLHYEWKKNHGKNYKETTDGGKEDKIRKTRFLAKDAKIKKHNSGNPTYLQAHNHFSDMVSKYKSLKIYRFPFGNILS
jgi:hypothetical protein